MGLFSVKQRFDFYFKLWWKSVSVVWGEMGYLEYNHGSIQDPLSIGVSSSPTPFLIYMITRAV